jgi:hypothetical protein
MRFKEKKSWVETWVKDHSNSQNQRNYQTIKIEKASSRIPVEAIKPKEGIIEINQESGSPWAFFFGFCQPQYCCTYKK